MCQICYHRSINYILKTHRNQNVAKRIENNIFHNFVIETLEKVYIKLSWRMIMNSFMDNRPEKFQKVKYFKLYILV